MKTAIFSKTSFATMVAVALGANACQQPPDLPPADSMEFISFAKGQSMVVETSEESDFQGVGATAMAQTMDGAGDGAAVPIVAGPTINVDTAALSVGLVTLGVNLALAAPRLLFAAALSDKPDHDRGSDTWTWEKTLPLAGWKAKLTGSLGDALELEMRVTGLRGQAAIDYQDFKWYDGSHQLDGGQWRIYTKEYTVGETLTIDWARNSPTDKSVLFTNVTTGLPESGDELGYTLLGNVATMAIHDALNADNVPADFVVSWNLVTGEGRMDRQGVSYCWDTLANGQVDIDCPASAWPTP